MLIGVAARRQVSNSLDFFLSGRSLAVWITGLAFISANLGTVEIIGMSANGAQYGMSTMNYYWIQSQSKVDRYFADAFSNCGMSILLAW
jgi:SSS family solute:Na+ symporter